MHLRYLMGSITHWDELFKQAYRVLKPGAWIQSYEADAVVTSEDGTVVEGSALDQWGKIFIEAGKKTGRTFLLIDDDVQRKGLEAAGFTNIVHRDTNVSIYVQTHIRYPYSHLSAVPNVGLARRPTSQADWELDTHGDGTRPRRFALPLHTNG